MPITVVTGNPNKLRELQAILGEGLTSMNLDLPEIQSLDLREVTTEKLRAAYQAARVPVLVEDVSAEVAALGGFPGPFVKFWEKQAGWEPALQVAEAKNDFRMTIRCAVAYTDGTQEIYEECAVPGTIVSRRGEDGWGFDFYFIPEGQTQTFAELGREWKSEHSHRGQALRRMRNRLSSAGVSL